MLLNLDPVALPESHLGSARCTWPSESACYFVWQQGPLLVMQLSGRCLYVRADGMWCSMDPRLVRGFLGGPNPASISSGAMIHGTAHPYLGACDLEAALSLGFTPHGLAIGLLKADKGGVVSRGSLGPWKAEPALSQERYTS